MFIALTSALNWFICSLSALKSASHGASDGSACAGWSVIVVPCEVCSVSPLNSSVMRSADRINFSGSESSTAARMRLMRVRSRFLHGDQTNSSGVERVASFLK